MKENITANQTTKCNYETISLTKRKQKKKKRNKD